MLARCPMCYFYATYCRHYNKSVHYISANIAQNCTYSVHSRVCRINDHVKTITELNTCVFGILCRFYSVNINENERATRKILILDKGCVSLWRRCPKTQEPSGQIQWSELSTHISFFYNAHAIMLTICLDTESGRETLTTSQPLWSPWEKINVPLFLGYWGIPWESWKRTPYFRKRSSNIARTGTSSITWWSSWNSSPVWQNFESSVDVIVTKPLRSRVREDYKLTVNYKFDLLRLPRCHTDLQLNVQRVNHGVALQKRADEPILKSRIPMMMY